MQPVTENKYYPRKYIWGHSQKGSRHWRWKGRIVDKDGYILIKRPHHPFANARGYVQLHRLIIEQSLTIKLGFPIYLLPYWVVHHHDNNKQNNSLQNLEVMNKRTHDSLPKVDFSKRNCVRCKSNKTYTDRQNQPRWYKRDNEFICSNCYVKEYEKSKRLKVASF